jgi:3D (Asp-Asp-Asp) domain-containing protein
MDLELRTGKPIRILQGDKETEVYSAAEVVAGVLVDAGIDLQGLDFTRPLENEPVPLNGRVEIVRVSEETLVETNAIPYTSERLPDTEMVIGEQKVLQTGQNGDRITSVRVRYENGEEVARESETEWISKQPITQKTAYGTRVVIQTSPEGLNYWLTKQVRIYSYRDTGNPTASGIWPYYGVIAVSPEWYSILKGTSMYVPGYGVGVVLDVCPGCSGQPWIDVFIPTEDYISWNRNEIVYFLAPAPANFSGDLP